MNPADPSFGFEELSHYAKFSRIAEGVDVIGRRLAGADEPDARRTTTARSPRSPSSSTPPTATCCA